MRLMPEAPKQRQPRIISNIKPPDIGGLLQIKGGWGKNAHLVRFALVFGEMR